MPDGVLYDAKNQDGCQRGKSGKDDRDYDVKADAKACLFHSISGCAQLFVVSGCKTWPKVNNPKPKGGKKSGRSQDLAPNPKMSEFRFCHINLFLSHKEGDSKGKEIDHSGKLANPPSPF